MANYPLHSKILLITYESKESTLPNLFINGNIISRVSDFGIVMDENLVLISTFAAEP